MINAENLPLVTVVTPSFNQGRFIENTILSVLSQDYPRVEYLIIDGGSSDNTLEILSKYEHRLTWISEPDQGQTDAINKGFLKANGEIVCWLNSDDTYEPGAINKAVRFLIDNPDVMMVYGEGNLINQNGCFIKRFPYTRAFDLWILTYLSDFILQPTTFFRREIFKKIDFLDVNLHWCMDWDLWIRIGSRFKVGYINAVLANARIYPNTKTATGGLRRLREIISLLQKHGRKTVPLGYFTYGGSSLETILKDNMGLLHLFLKPLLSLSKTIIRRRMYTCQGVYMDHWLGPKARLMLPVQEGASSVRFALDLPDDPFLVPNKLQIKLNNHLIATQDLPTAGKFKVAVPLVQDGHPIEVEIKFKRYLTDIYHRRKLSCRFDGYAFVPC